MLHTIGDRLLHRQFVEQARRTPEATALIEDDRAISFSELHSRAESVASALRKRGIGPGSTVGLYLERSVGWVVALLGVLETNAAVMPLPPTYPAGRLRSILDAAGLDLVIDDDEARLDPGLGAGALHLAALEADPGPSVESEPGLPDQPALVLASSGSTGTPKMIVRSHASFHHRLRWTWEQHPYERGEVCCQKAQATTTHATYELFEPLLRGTPVVLIPDRVARDLEAFWNTLRQRNITRLLIVPSALQSSLDMPDFSAPPLNVVVLMGEYVNPHLAARALKAFSSSTRVYSIYGSTEASSTLVCDLRMDLRTGEELPLGRPISGEIRPIVLAEDLKPVAPGTVGRLYMAGPANFAGYFRDPELTASAFIDVPEIGERLYDTQDQVRRMPDGSLQFIGRSDDTVKIRGFRVDLQEVERTLLDHPAVRRAAAVVDGAASGNAVLHAFVSPAGVDRGSIFGMLRERLPSYMIPSTLTTLDEMPVTARGKLDRARLVRDHVGGMPDRPSEEDFSDTERRIADVWTRTLGHGGFDVDSSFFEVGGTSLSVFTMVHRLRSAFSLEPVRLPEQVVYTHPSIGQLADYVDQVRAGTSAEVAPAPSLLITMRRGADRTAEPFFLVSSAGGTLGAYDKLARALATRREVVGIRDPFLDGERDLGEGFPQWVGRYLGAIRERQPHGPYYIGAYSSAGAFGFEIARMLRAVGEEVAMLVLIDPLSLDRRSRRRYGWWALWAIWTRPPIRALVRLLGWLRILAHRLVWRGRPVDVDDRPLSDDPETAASSARRDTNHLKDFSALLELNTGLPLTLEDADFAGVPPERLLSVLLARVTSLMPDVDPSTIERILVQYGVQVRAQHAYRLQPYDGRVLLVQPATYYAGLVSANLRPYVRRLEVRMLGLGEPTARIRSITERFGAIAPHYRSMRDDVFVQALTQEVDRVLG